MVPVLVISWYLALALGCSVKQLDIEGYVFEALVLIASSRLKTSPLLRRLFISRGIPKH
jgi:hypothetical protein